MRFLLRPSSAIWNRGISLSLCLPSALPLPRNFGIILLKDHFDHLPVSDRALKGDTTYYLAPSSCLRRRPPPLPLSRPPTSGVVVVVVVVVVVIVGREVASSSTIPNLCEERPASVLQTRDRKQQGQAGSLVSIVLLYSFVTRAASFPCRKNIH